MKDNMAIMEYYGYVTQLGAGSEVVIIGIKMETPLGGYIEITNLTLNFGNTSGDKVGQIRLFNTQNVALNILTVGMDNSSLPVFPAVLDASATGINNQQGFMMPIKMGGKMYMKFECTDTLTAGIKLKIFIMYKTRNGVLPTFSAIGAGITLTEVSNQQIA